MRLSSLHDDPPNTIIPLATDLVKLMLRRSPISVLRPSPLEMS